MPSEYVDRITYKPFEYLAYIGDIEYSTIIIHLRTTLFSTSTMMNQYCHQFCAKCYLILIKRGAGGRVKFS